MKKIFIGAALAMWFLTGTGLIFGQSSPPPGKTAPAVWRTYVQPAGGFAVTSPIPLDTHLSVPFQSPGGPLTLRQFIGLRRDDAYFACFMDMNSGEMSEEASRELGTRLFGTFVNDVAKIIGGKVLEDRPVTVLGHPGRRFRVQFAVEGEEMTSHGQVALIGRRFYFLQVVEPVRETPPQAIAGKISSARKVAFRKGTTADQTAEDRTRFLESFRLMTDAEKEKFGATRSDALVPADSSEPTIDPSKVKPLPPPDKTPSTDVPSGPIRRSEGVLRQNALIRVAPEYPKDAAAARIEGDVVCEILIDVGGNVTEARVLSGPPELHSAALAAVRQWIFKPTLLNGRLVRVTGGITFRFTLSEKETAT